MSDTLTEPQQIHKDVNGDRDYPETPNRDDIQNVAPPQGALPESEVAPAESEPEEKPSLLVRKVGTRDIGWLNRIFVQARNSVRKKGRTGELDELGYEKDEETGNYLGIGFQEMIDISWDKVEKDLNLWTADLTGKTPEECAEDVSILFSVIEELDEGGKLSPLFRMLMRLQGRTFSRGEQDTSSQ